MDADSHSSQLQLDGNSLQPVGENHETLSEGTQLQSHGPPPRQHQQQLDGHGQQDGQLESNQQPGQQELQNGIMAGHPHQALQDSQQQQIVQDNQQPTLQDSHQQPQHSNQQPTIHGSQQNAPQGQPQISTLHEPQLIAFDVEDFCGLRLRKMNDTETVSIMHQIFLWGTKGEIGAGKTIENYLLEKGMSWSNYKQVFNSSQREKITNEPSGHTFDVTLLYLAIKFTCDGVAPSRSDVWIKEGDNLEATLTALKKFRNDLMHDVSRMSKSAFIMKSEVLRELLGKALKFAGNVYSIEPDIIDNRLREMNKALNIIRDGLLISYDITSDEMQKAFEGRLEILRNSGKNEIADIFKKFSNFNPVSFITGQQMHLNVGLVFTRLEVIDNQKNHSNEERENESIEYENLLEFGSAIQELSKKIKLLDGPAGSGKTTLTRKVMDDWSLGSTTMVGLASHDLLIYMECRDSSNSSFSQLLTSLMPNTAQKFNDGDLVKCVLALKLIIIVDGIDELNTESLKLFKEILSLKRKHSITLVCTSRPETVEDFFRMVPCEEEVAHLKIVGITDAQQEEFASRYHEEMRRQGRSKQETNGLLEYLRTTGSHLQDHWRLPLNLVLLTVLWAIAPESVNTVTTATELYFEIYKLTIQKLIERFRFTESTQNQEESMLRYKIEMFVLELCREALFGLKNNEIILSEETMLRLRSFCMKIELPIDQTFGAFLVTKTHLTATGMQSKTSFPHKGLQDFIGAIYVLLKLKARGIRLDISSLITFDLNFLYSHAGLPRTSINLGPHPPAVCLRPENESTVSGNVLTTLYHNVCKLGVRSYNRFRYCMKTASEMGNITPMTLISLLRCSFDLMEILEEVHPGKRDDIIFGKFNNTFVHLTGLLHITCKGNIKRCLVVELVKVLYKTGVRTREQWLDLLSNVKCDPVVAEVIAQRSPNLTEEQTTIHDRTVYSYNSLYQKMCPKQVNVNISAKVNNIPHLEDLLQLLCQHGSQVAKLECHYEFQRPAEATDTLDDTLLELFEICEVKTYRGAMSSRLYQILPDTIERLLMGVENHEQYSLLHKILIPSSCRLPLLRRLVLHMSRGIDHTQLEPLPPRLYVHLYLSDVNPSSLEWAVQTIRALQPVEGSTGRGFTTLFFARCTLDVSDFERLIQELALAKVRLDCLCTSANIPEENFEALMRMVRGKLKAKFQLMAENDIWTKY